MAKQQTLTIVVPDHEDDPADTVREAYSTLGFAVVGPGEDVGRHGVVIIEEA